MSKTIILPACDDGNRGDQALVWQTREIAQKAGLADETFMLTNDVDGSSQSKAEGIQMLMPILRHPRYRTANDNSVQYGRKTVFIWGLTLLLDSLRAILLLLPVGRKVLKPFLSTAERQTISQIDTADACFVKGGGFVHSTASFTDPYRVFYFLYHLFLAHSLKTRVYVMPNSFGPLDGRIFRFIVKRALNKCVLVTTRESISRRELKKIGVSALEFPDLAFGLTAQPSTEGYLEGAANAAVGRQIVGITARPYRFPGSTNPQEDYRNYISEMALFAKHIFSIGYFPVFIEHVVSEGAHESDINAIMDIVKHLEPGQFYVFSNPSLSSRQMRAVYKECDYVVGTRFHSVIFSLGEKVPAMAIAYGGNKGNGIMQDIGFANYVIPIEKFSSEKAAAIFESVVRDDAYRVRLDDLEDEISAQYDSLIEIIKKS